MKITSIVIALFLCTSVLAQVPDLAIQLIPEQLKKNADVVKRYESISFDVKSISQATLKVHRILTVLNERGKLNLFFSQFSNKFISLEDAEIKVYDTSGKQLKRYKKKELNSFAVGEGLIEDGKVFLFKVNSTNYPVTVEYEYTEQYNGTLFYPSYQILTPGEAVENSVFSAKVPLGLDLRFREQNFHLSPTVREDGGYKIYEWSVKNLLAIEDEQGSVSFESRYPAIILAPNRFKLQDFEGDMTSWKQFGLWYYQLKKGMDVLPEDRVSFFRGLVKNASTDEEKARIIYGYLQKSFRYVSIQLGIGGFQPLPAAFTDQKKYGDCKGLSNYMQAALEAVGIKSYQALINASYNKESVSPDFPCNKFNHVILCIPRLKDSIWLECTSKTNDFGVLGTFTENRNALLITENGGVLVPTPQSNPASNILSVSTNIKIEENGHGQSISTVSANGDYKNRFIYFLSDRNADDQKEFLINNLGFKQPDYVETEINKDADKFNMSVKMEFEKIAEFISGSKMFLLPRIYKIWSAVLPKSENRKLDFYFESPFSKNDTTIYMLPEGYKVDALPEAKKIQCQFASYATAYWYDQKQNAVCSSANLTLYRHKIPSADYAIVKKFFDDVLQDFSQRMVVKSDKLKAF